MEIYADISASLSVNKKVFVKYPIFSLRITKEKIRKEER